MRKIVVLLFFLVLGFNSFAQDWKKHLELARNSYKNGDYKSALKHYEICNQQKPKKVDLTSEIAQTTYKSQQFSEAEKLYQKNTFKYVNSTDKAKSYHNLGNSHLKQENYKEAISAYKEALRNNPNDEETRYNLAKAMKKENQSQQENKQEKQQQNSSKQNNNPSKQEEKEENKQQNQSNLQDKKTERMLDDLMKKEIETKKKMDSKRASKTSNNTNSQKDW
jgi:Ca-activated chloride channel homolog